MFSDSVRADGRCDGKPCWKEKDHGFEFKEHESDDGEKAKIKLEERRAGEAKISVKTEGIDLGPLALPLTPPATVQLVRTDAPVCWEATFSRAMENRTGKFKARSD